MHAFTARHLGSSNVSRLRRSVGAAVVLGAVLLVSAPILGVGTGEGIEQSASATATGRRGTSVQLAPPPLAYPSGFCDRIAPDLPGLNRRVPAQLRRIGTSVQGRPIWAEYWGPPAPASVVVIVAQVHGDECSPTLVTDEVRTRPPARRGVWLVPTLNPDGYANHQRRNANQVDLNADGWNVSQPETAALMSLIADVRPELTIHIHSPNGFAGAYSPFGPGRASALCRALALQTAITCSGGGAGTRSDRSRWFLWQGQARFGGESLLVELHAVADSEVPLARPRPPTRSVAQVRGEARVIVDLLDGL